MSKNKGALLEFLEGFFEETNNNKENSILAKDKKERDKNKEKQMDAYNLEEWQKKLVREGKYEPWDFDEEDLEEGDYYYDDK